MQHSEQINELATALAKAQAEITGAKKGTENPFFRSKYADLAEVWDVIRVPLSKNGLSVAQVPRVTRCNGETIVGLATYIFHSSGQFLVGELDLRPAKDDPQAIGSAITYARRYALAAAVGVAQEDDDANAATHPDKNASMSSQKAAPKENKKSLKDECTALAEKLGIPKEARKAMVDDAKGDLVEVCRRLKHALAEREAREAETKEDDSAQA